MRTVRGWGRWWVSPCGFGSKQAGRPRDCIWLANQSINRPIDRPRSVILFLWGGYVVRACGPPSIARRPWAVAVWLRTAHNGRSCPPNHQHHGRSTQSTPCIQLRAIDRDGGVPMPPPWCAAHTRQPRRHRRGFGRRSSAGLRSILRGGQPTRNAMDGREAASARSFHLLSSVPPARGGGTGLGRPDRLTPLDRSHAWTSWGV